MKRLRFLGVALLVFAVLVSGCIGNGTTQTVTQQVKTTETVTETIAPTHYPLTVKDFADREVKIEKKPQRIVSLAPSVTETLYFLGALDSVVGVTKFDDYPPGVQGGREIIGGFSDPNIEVIASLQPDLIIGTSMHLKYLDQLEAIAPVIILDPKNMEEVYRAVQLLGDVLDEKGKAEGVVEFMKAEVEGVKFRVANATRPKVFFISWWNPIYTPGKNTFQGDLIELAGGENIFSDLNGWAQVSMEDVLARNPDVIILSAHSGITPEEVCKSELANTNAVKNGRIYVVSDDNAISRPGPRLVDALKELSYFIHPEAYGYSFQPVSCPVEG
ncbi:ABC transporter substrate-binding protein [Palaeococcus ferrophilus]|uniref:ABC transporter substrate-binding protein n=1 Tax=Palaeococcus ferrophilus TaxID=83868 RepID=UPI00064F60DF|nr:ABC transporter substrate-binding protein [Palaeococcus ferrophilus]